MREITFAESIREAIREEMIKDKNVILIGEEIGRGYGGVFEVSKGLLEEFGPGQIIDTPIVENTIMGCGIGTALLGMKPIVELMFADFVTVCFDGIINQAAKIKFMSGDQFNLNLVIRLPGGGGDGMGPQHSQNLESIFMSIPGLKIAVPSNPFDAKGLLKTAINLGEPVLFFENRKLYKTKGFVPEDEYFIPLGKGSVVRKGTDITIIATAYMVNIAKKAAEKLKTDRNLEIEIIDPRTIVPLDEELIAESLSKTSKVIIIEEGTLRGGLGSEIAAIISEKYLDYLDYPIKRIASKDTPLPASYSLEQMVIPDEKRVCEEILKFLNLH